jgi:hypothetical protein
MVLKSYEVVEEGSTKVHEGECGYIQRKPKEIVPKIPLPDFCSIQLPARAKTKSAMEYAEQLVQYWHKWLHFT